MAIKIKREEREDGSHLITVTDTRPYLNWTYEDNIESDDVVKEILNVQNFPSHIGVIDSILLYSPYLYGTQWASLIDLFNLPIIGETYGVGAMFKLENPDYKETQGETKFGLVTVNQPLTIQKDVSWESLKDYNDNGIVSMINYSDIERK
ncbi:hypothetical protein [Clostridium sp.]|uniref:hypothetical protein n=1 Tax=Clostridium sp. TaxID=1506 RepID=UPI0029081D6E|nr:hypothetical protein [Clostridium sp.]MDU7005345.1 hypothetical protein [Clostridium sp.]